MLSKSVHDRSGTARILRWMKAVVLVSGLVTLCAIGYAAGYMVTAARSFAQDTEKAADGGAPKPIKHVAKLTSHKPKAQQATLPSAPPAAATDFAARLEQAGATTCAHSIDALANASMQGTTASANASNWFIAAPNARPVNIVIAQKFAAPSVPYGATDIFASPAPQAKCDAFALQVIPSPLSCDQLRQNIVARGKMIAELVGIPLLQDVNGQIILVPTQANACVLIGLRIAYAR